MTTARKHFIPHPLITLEKKSLDIWMTDQKENPESLEKYVRDSFNPRWASCHIISAISRALANHDFKASKELADIAARLSQTVKTKEEAEKIKAENEVVDLPHTD